MIEQLGAEGWTGWMYPRGEPPIWLGVMGAFALNAGQQLFAFRATGDDLTHVRHWTSKDNADPDSFVFGCADETLYIFTRDLSEANRATLAAWNERTDLSPDFGVIGADELTPEAASDYNSPQGAA